MFSSLKDGLKEFQKSVERMRKETAELRSQAITTGKKKQTRINKKLNKHERIEITNIF